MELVRCAGARAFNVGAGLDVGAVGANLEVGFGKCKYSGGDKL